MIADRSGAGLVDGHGVVDPQGVVPVPGASPSRPPDPLPALGPTAPAGLGRQTALLSPSVVIERVAAGGDGIGHLSDGRVVFVTGALPGERAEVEVDEVRRDFARGHAVRLLHSSPDRVAPPCPNVARGCGGCGWQHVGLRAALELKVAIVAEALRRAGTDVDPVEMLPPVALPLSGYRTIARLAVAPDGRLGYHRRRSADCVPVDGCLVAHPRLEALIGAARVWGVPEVTLRVGAAGGERLVVLGSDGRSAARVEVPDDVRVVGSDGRGWVREEVGGRMWRVSARSFFQAGPAGAEAVVDAVDAAVGDALASGGLLVDAYAGVGVIGGVIAARRGARLVAVESGADAVRDARRNLADLDATVVKTEVGRWVAAAPAVDVVVADPARSGLGRPGVTALGAAGATRLVLVSCDPASLGRDAALLGAAGYRLRAVRVVDILPGTPHVETVSRFDRDRGGRRP